MNQIKHMKKIATLCLLVFCINSLKAQPWIDRLPQPATNFYDIQKSFYDFWKDKDISEKGRGYTPFRRWEYFVEPRVYPTGNLLLLSNNWENFKAFQSNAIKAGHLTLGANTANSTWVPMGPIGSPTGVNNYNIKQNVGRDNFITFHPSNPSIFWIGAPAGGLWKTTNSGGAWLTNTDYLTVIGCSDLAVDPTNPNIMYLATGDMEQGDTRSIGVLKSTDGGITWNNTGLSFTIIQARRMSRILVNPNNTQILLAATSVGIYRSTDAGANWTQVTSSAAYDMEFKPGDPNTVYASGTAFYLSTNGGQTFSTISNGISTAAERMKITVTAADPNYVYALSSNPSNSGLQGVYRSVSSGTAFTLMTSSPDILNGSCSNPAAGGQGWYDLTIAASPLDKNEVAVGGINIWRSTNGGANFNIIGCWNSAGSSPLYVHADQHELEYNNAGTLYACNDGGLFSYNGSSWADLNATRNISQIYKMGLSGVSPNKWITGHQDNGTNIYNNGVYSAAVGADGMDCFIDRTNDNNMFASWQNGNFLRSSNGGAFWTNAGITGSAWLCPWKQDPQNASVIYAGTSQLYSCTLPSLSWSQLGTTGVTGNIKEFAIAPSNNQVIYVIHNTALRKSIDGGTTWTAMSGVPTSLGAPTFITVSPTDPNKLWVTLSGYSAANKVFQSTNGGQTWTNITYNLPNLPANCSVYQVGSNDLIYVGMDIGVYCKDINTNTWTLYNSGLPNTPISDMEISAANPNKLRASTYGRGVYEVDLYQVTAPPVSNFYIPSSICSSTSRLFQDASNNSPNAWSWSVQPSAGVNISSVTVQSPSITFANAGIYTISMVASNSIGIGSVVNQTVLVNASPNITFSIPSNTVCIDEVITVSVSGAQSYVWSPGSFVGASYTFTAGVSQTFSVNAQNSNGCLDVDSLHIVVSKCDGVAEKYQSRDVFSLYPNPSNGKLIVAYKGDKNMAVEMELIDGNGKVAYKQSVLFKRDRPEALLNISHLLSGVYTLRLKTADDGVQLLKLLKE